MVAETHETTHELAPSTGSQRRGFVVSRVLGRIAATEGSSFAAFAFYVTFLGSVQLLTVGLSLFHAPISQVVAIGILAMSVLVAWRYWRLLPWETGSSDPSPVRAQTTCYILFAALFYGAMWFFACIKPDFSADGNVYHIPTIHFWAVKGYVHWIEVDNSLWTGSVDATWNGYPKGIELVSFILVRATGANGPVNTGNLVYLPLAVLGLAHLARAFGACPGIALVAGVTYVFAPVNVMQSPTTLTDSGYAACVIAVLAGACRCWTVVWSGAVPWTTSVALGCAMGLALGAKGSGPVAAALGMVAVMAVAGLAALRGASRPTKLSRLLFIRNTILFLMLTSLVAVSVGGYWQIRNYLIKGSPLFPVGVTVAGREVFPGKPPEEVICEDFNTPEMFTPWSRGRQIWYTWRQAYPDWPKTILSDAARHGGLGYLWLLGCVPSVLLVLAASVAQLTTRTRRKRSATRPLFPMLAISAAAYVALLFYLTPMNWWARYTLWIYGAGLPCLALIMSRVLRTRLLVRSMLGIWVAACLVVAVFEGAYCLAWSSTRTYWNTEQTWPDFGQAGRRAAWTLVWHDPAGYLFPPLSGTAMEEILAGTDPVAVPYWKPFKIRFVGQLSQPIGARPIYFLPNNIYNDSIQLEAYIQTRNIRYIVWDEEVMQLPESIEELATRIDRGAMFTVAEMRPASS